MGLDAMDIFTQGLLFHGLNFLQKFALGSKVDVKSPVIAELQQEVREKKEGGMERWED